MLRIGGNTIVLTIQAQQPLREVFAVDQEAVPDNPKYFMKVNQTTAADTARKVIDQRVEGVATSSGKTSTISFWAKASSPKTLVSNIYQYFGSGGSTSSVLYVDNSTLFNITTAW